MFSHWLATAEGTWPGSGGGDTSQALRAKYFPPKPWPAPLRSLYEPASNIAKLNELLDRSVSEEGFPGEAFSPQTLVSPPQQSLVSGSNITKINELLDRSLGEEGLTNNIFVACGTNARGLKKEHLPALKG